ncbi:MAG: sigma-54-dependent transcriptional regulator [Candidatus Krumholzibacteriia bacterium]
MMSGKKILVVEDESIVQLHLRKILTELGYEVSGVATNAADALETAADAPPDLVLMDIRLQGERDGIDTARELKKRHGVSVVFLTAHADKETVARTQEVGAVGYIVKPFNQEEVRAVLMTAFGILREIGTRRSGMDPRDLEELRRMVKKENRFHDLIGADPSMRDVFEKIQEFSQVDWTVLVEGETGTGKELVSRAIHTASPRCKAPFIAVNCAALTETLLSSQLFGHKKGAFTSAVTDQKGLFEAADGGTLFLDEIGDITRAVQNSLLRVLEDREVTRLGESRPRKVDVRLITATQRDLAEEVSNERFRADLLFRIRVARIGLPPLRQRGADVSLLAHWFLSRASEDAGKVASSFSDAAMALLTGYAWPGNVRELKSAVEHAVLSSRQRVVQVDDLPPELTGSSPMAPAVHRDERERVLAALIEAGGNRTQAARLLGISRATLYRRITELGISDEPPVSQ